MLDQVQSPFISILTLLRSKGRDLGDRSMIHFLDISIFADHKWSWVPASADYKCCHVFADDKSHLHIYICLPITSDILLFLDYKHCPSMFVGYTCPSVCWLQVLSSYIGCCPLMFADCKWLPPVSWLQELSFSVCWLHMLSSNVHSLKVLSSYVGWLQMLSSYVCWLQVLSYVFWLQVLSYVCWLQVLSYVCWLQVLSYVCWLQVLSYVCCLQILSDVCWLQVLSYVGWLQVLS